MKARMNLFIAALWGLFILCPKASAVSDSNLVAHWKFEEGSGTTAYDSAGNNHGNVYGAQWTTGIIGGALSFDGVNDYVQIPDADCLTPHDEITISWWVFRVGGPDIGGIYKYAFSPNQQYSPGNSRAYICSMDRMSICSAVNTYDTIWNNNPTSLNEWHHILGTFNRGQAAIYVDGELKVAKSLSVSSIMNDVQPLTIGGCWDYGGEDRFVSTLNGLADDVRIYNRALSAEEVRQVYQEVFPPGEIYYVDGVHGSDLNDGLSLETAFATIQKGIDTARDSDTVLVYPGLYQEGIDFLGKAITVQGIATTAGISVLENPGDFAVSFNNGEEPDSILKNFVIRNSFMAIFIADSSPTLSNLTVVNNNYGIRAYVGSEPHISNCIFWNNAEADLVDCQARYSCNYEVGEGNINADPCFVDSNNSDYHLLSKRGRYWPQHDVWVLDKVTSPCVDGGDPNDAPADEPMPNGGRIDMGAYGGTPYASMSEWPITSDINCDGAVDFVDLAIFCNEWLSTLPWAK